MGRAGDLCQWGQVLGDPSRLHAAPGAATRRCGWLPRCMHWLVPQPLSQVTNSRPRWMSLHDGHSMQPLRSMVPTLMSHASGHL